MLIHDLSWAGEGGFETKALRDGADVASFAGIASTSDRDRAHDIIEAGAFGTIVAKEVRMFRDHNREHLIGGWQKFEQQGKQLTVEGVITLLTEKGRETYSLMKQGFLNGLSVGFMIEPGGVVWDEAKQLRIIKKASLLECSVVSLPANRGAKISSVKSLSRDDTWQWLRDNGMPDADIEIVMRKGFDALLERRSRRVEITEIDGFHASKGDDDAPDDAKLTALADQLRHFLDDVRERRAP